MRRLEVTLTGRQVREKRVFIGENDRGLFPHTGQEFTIRTNIAEAGVKKFSEAKIVPPHDAYHIHLRKAKWFEDFKLKSGDKLVFEIEPEKGEYHLVQILRK